MGKEERRTVELMEKEVARFLNDERYISTLDPYIVRRVRGLASYIREQYEFASAQHIGNVYGTSIGDIRLAGRTTYHLELKFVKSGTGTRANISQNALTHNRLFEESSVLSWQKFRCIKDHNSWVFDLLSQYAHFPFDPSTLKPTQRSISKMGRIVRDRVSVDTDARRVRDAIVRKDKEEKLEYLGYLSTLKQNRDNILKFALLILMGRHTVHAMRPFEYLDLAQTVARLPDNYQVIYVYKKAKDEYRRENLHTLLRNIHLFEARLAFRRGQTNVAIEFSRDGECLVVLRFSLHWKNVFQGIETPCLNVFDENLHRLLAQV